MRHIDTNLYLCYTETRIKPHIGFPAGLFIFLESFTWVTFGWFNSVMPTSSRRLGPHVRLIQTREEPPVRA
jgi:hypothetical protein